MNFKPLNDRLLIKRDEAPSQSAGGIILPEDAKEKPMQGKIVACGDGVTLENGERRPLSVKPGQTVLFRKYAGTEVSIKHEEFMIMRESELLGVVDA